MVFSSLEFLLWFLPFFLLIYYLSPEKYRNFCLFGFSMVFYAYGVLGHPAYLFLLPVSVGINYLFGRWIGTNRRRLPLVLGMIWNFGMLGLFKYSNFFAETVNMFLEKAGWPYGGIPLLSLALPIGISFYTFQAASYLIDVYRGTVRPENRLLYLGTYLVMFPKLISGPIVRYGSVAERLKKRKCTKKMFLRGLEVFVLGLAFKVLLANRLGGLWQNIGGIGYESISTPLAWMGIVAYSLQIYFDFYGYSLMAVGLGRMIGFSLPVNFKHPYISCSMTEFWRRWHITLGSWFRDYVYIPLGGNRKGGFRTVCNLLAVWLLTGLWHGAGWNFILWGMFLFAVIAMEKWMLGTYLNRFRVAGHLYMMILIPVSWLIFAETDLVQLGIYLQRLVGLGGINVYAGDFLKYLSQYGIFLLLGLVFATRLPEKLFWSIPRKPLRYVLLAAMLAASVYGIYMGMNDPFLYFQF